MKCHPIGFRALCALVAVFAALLVNAATEKAALGKAVGIYVHQHWSYKHPYAARTWTLDDWRGYLDGVHRLGYNTVLIWPMLETMPDPLTSSDEATLRKIAEVIRMAHDDFSMRVHIVFCPNVAPQSEEARKYTFEDRPFFRTDARVDPGDAVAFGRLMEWRERLLKPLAAMDGMFIIDSDPGGYANSTNLEFVYILGAHRRVLDRLRPGVEIYYWAHAGWEAYGRYYATGTFKIGEKEEIQDAIALLAKQGREPWGVAGRFPDICDPLGMSDRVLSFQYGAIESEPSFPLTRLDQRAAAGGARLGARGVMGNAQTHCVQLPNTFAFARGAGGLPIERADYIQFGNELIPGQGELLVDAWETLQSNDSAKMDLLATQLDALAKDRISPGPLKGLLFGEPTRFVDDLSRQLRMLSAFHRFHRAVETTPRNMALVKSTLAEFATVTEKWQQKHGYRDMWRWPALADALAKLGSPQVEATMATLEVKNAPGNTPYERVSNYLGKRETFTLQLIEAMKRTARDIKLDERISK